MSGGHVRQCIVMGAGGHAKMVVSCMREFNMCPAAYVEDDPPEGKRIGAFPVISVAGMSDFLRTYCEVRSGVVAVGDNVCRERWLNLLMTQYNLSIPDVVHPWAKLMGDPLRGSVGSVVMPGAVIEVGAELGDGCIVNTGASIGHGSIVGKFTHIAPGARIGGDAQIGDYCVIGINASVNRGVSIGNGRVVPSGKAVIADIPDAPKRVTA